MTTEQKESILYQAQVWVSDIAYELMHQKQYSEACDKNYDKAFTILNYLNVLLDTCTPEILTEDQKEVIYLCIQTTLNLDNYPVAPLLSCVETPVTFITGGIGPQGPQGAPGVNGTDANINVITTDPNLEVIETVVAGVKTFNVLLAVYTAPTVNLTLDGAAIPDPNQTNTVEIGVVISTLPVSFILTKGKELVTASVITAPAGLNTAYQSELDLVDLNTTGSQSILLNATNVSTNTTYTVTITDGTTTNQDTESINFVYPFLYGDSTSLLTTTHYIDLTKLIQTKANKTVIFNSSLKYFWFGYPASYGDLVQISDQNGFDVTSGFTKLPSVSVTSSGLDNNWTVNYIFYRTTEITTINGNYTFKFNF